MNKYYLVDVSLTSYEVTKFEAREIYDVVVSALDRWRYGKTETERKRCVNFYVSDGNYQEGKWEAIGFLVSDNMAVDIKLLSSLISFKEAEDDFDKEKYIRSFILGEWG